MKTLKKQIRSEVQKKERLLTQIEKSRSDQQIFQNVIHLPAYQNARVLFCFVSMPNEVNTHAIIEHAWKQGKIVCVPRCISLGQMDAVVIHAWNELEPGTWGIGEPQSYGTIMEPAHIDLALIPCCSASRDGRRLGFGGGFYDRYVASQPFVKAVLCREVLMREDIPMETFDQKMDIVINEAGVYV